MTRLVTDFVCPEPNDRFYVVITQPGFDPYATGSAATREDAEELVDSFRTFAGDRHPDAVFSILPIPSRMN